MVAWIIVIVLAFLLICSAASAGGKGHGRGSTMRNMYNQGSGPKSNWNAGMPPGSVQGEKQGWQGNQNPRGWDAQGRKQGWNGGLYPKGIDKKQPLP